MSDRQGKSQRRLRNLLLKPSLQVRLGAMYILISLGFSGTISGIFYWKLSGVIPLVLELTDVQEEVQDLLTGYLNEIKWLIIGTVAVFMVINILFSIIYTHRLIGPSFAFRRHLQALIRGEYGARTHLRKGDAFQEVAEDLNRLSMSLKQKYPPPPGKEQPQTNLE